MYVPRRDRARAKELADALGPIRLGEPPALTWFVPELRTLLGAENTLSYRLETSETTARVAFLQGEGFSQPAEALAGLMNRALADPRGWGMYDIRSPEPAQRNRVFAIAPIVRVSRRELGQLGLTGAAAARVEGRLELARATYQAAGLVELHQLRVLLCEGGRLLAWVGAFREGSFGPEEAGLLRELMPPLLMRLRAERELAGAEQARRGLDAALELLDRPAYVIDRRGRVLHANEAGLHLWDSDAGGVAGGIREALRHAQPGGFELVPIRGAEGHLLALAPARAHLIAEKTHRSIERWRLTPRQGEVLALLARGKTNKDIAEALRCAESTIELHVTAILEKVGADSRAAAVAAFWRDA